MQTEAVDCGIQCNLISAPPLVCWNAFCLESETEKCTTEDETTDEITSDSKNEEGAVLQVVSIYL